MPRKHLTASLSESNIITLAFFHDFISGGKSIVIQIFYCYANFSIVVGPKFRGELLRGGGIPPVEDRRLHRLLLQTEILDF